MSNPERDQPDRVHIVGDDDIVPSSSEDPDYKPDEAPGTPKKTTSQYIKDLNEATIALREGMRALTPDFISQADREPLQAKLLELNSMKTLYDAQYQEFDKSVLDRATIHALVKQNEQTDLYISQIRAILGNTRFTIADQSVRELTEIYNKLASAKDEITPEYVQQATVHELKTRKDDFATLFTTYMTKYQTIPFNDLSADEMNDIPIQKGKAEHLAESMETYFAQQIKLKEPASQPQPPQISNPDPPKTAELQQIIDRLNADLNKEKQSHEQQLTSVNVQLEQLRNQSLRERTETEEKIKSLEAKLDGKPPSKSKPKKVVQKESDFDDIMYQQEQDFVEGEKSVVTLKLDAIKVPTFSGDLTEWEEFKDLFEYLIHNNKNISNPVKFNELRNHLTGIALDTIRGYAITGTNYQSAWADLKKRFDRKDELIDEYIRRFLNIPEIKQRATFINLRAIVDTTNQMLRALPSLGVSVTHWDPFVSFVISTKLDRETMHDWIQKRGTGERPPASEYVEWLETRAIELQPSYVKKPREDIHKPKKRIFQVNEKPKPEAEKPKKEDDKAKKCFVCDGNHRVTSCPKLKAECAKVRTDIIKSLKLCFKCLLKHKIGMCNEEDCTYCGGPHNLLLCYKKENAEKPRRVSLTPAPKSNQARCSANDDWDDLGQPSTSKNFR